MNKPILNYDAPLMVDFCSCGGGVKTGALLAGFRPKEGVEMNPKGSGLSQHYRLIQRQNFAEYGSSLQLRTVQEAQLNGFDGITRNPTLMHASPPCTNYSRLRTFNNYTETKDDIEIGGAIAAGIITINPTYFTLECSPSYESGQAFQIIKTGFEVGGYDFACHHIDFQDYDTPQSRKRLIVLAWQKGTKPFRMPPKTRLIGWGEAISVGYDSLIKSSKERLIVKPSQSQQKIIDVYLDSHAPTPIMIDKIGSSKKNGANVRETVEPIWTITASMFTDQSKRERNISLTYYDAGFMYALNIRDVARLCGFPDWYALSEVFSLAGSVLGNAVCPSFYSYLLRSNNLTN